MKEYIVIREGYVSVKGQPFKLRIGQKVSELMFKNYPNYINEVVIEDKKEILNEKPTEPVKFVEETENIETLKDNEEETEDKPKRSRKPKK